MNIKEMKKNNMMRSHHPFQIQNLPSKGPYMNFENNSLNPPPSGLLHGTLQTPKQNLITEIGNLTQLGVEGTSTFFGQTNFYNKVFLSNLSTHHSNIGIESNINIHGRIHLFDSLILPENDIIMKKGKIYVGKQYLINNMEEKSIECHGNFKIVEGELIFSDGSKQKKGFEKIEPSPEGEYKNMNCIVNEYGQIIKASSNSNIPSVWIKKGNTRENFIGVLDDSVPRIEFYGKEWNIQEYCVFRLHFSVFYHKNHLGIYEKTSSFSGLTYIYPYRLTSHMKLDSYQPSKFKWCGSIVGKNIFHFIDSKIIPHGRPYWTVSQNPVVGNDVFYLYGDEKSISLQIINPHGWDSNEEFDFSLMIESFDSSYIQFINFE